MICQTEIERLMMVTITLPDGSKKEFESAVSIMDIAQSIGSGLARATLAGMVNETLVDTTYMVDKDSQVELVTAKDKAGLKLMRHSAAHVMAEAIARLYPGTKFAYGPAIDDGFYYDVDASESISADDLKKIEKEMKRIVKSNVKFVRNEMTRAEAEAKYADDEYKLDNIRAAKGEVISFYGQGEFEDLCLGPHVPSTGKIGNFKLMSIAGAYWHGDANKQQLTRIYGTTFASKEELQEHLYRIEEAKKRDHRVIGKQMGLFEFHPKEAQGMAFWRNNGVILYRELENYLRQIGEENGFEEFRTPQIMNRELWEISGHWQNYADKNYTCEKDGKEYAVKPMNCPGALILYKSELYSHNDLPLRWAEFGHVHRYEGSGEIHGLVRVRGFTQDDAHVFCTPEQLQDEIKSCIQLIFEVYRTTGLNFDHIELSTKPEKSIGSQEMWDKAEAALAGALKQLDIDFVLNPGDGAFYGPKIDFHLKDAIGRSWQMGTIQVDFSLPERFDITYVAADSTKKRPVMIHRAISGSLERFIGVLTEHYAGDFPLWLAPEQVRVLSVVDAHNDYAKEVVAALKKQGIRAKADVRSSKIGAKIREGELAKVQYLAIVGATEAQNKSVSVRRRKLGDLGEMSVTEFAEKLVTEITSKALPPQAE